MNKHESYNLTKPVSGEVEYFVIGAGLPRTGTLSTFNALEHLLPGRCHHMARAQSGFPDQEFWTRASLGQLSDQDWRDFIRESQLSASVDYPMSLFWKDLARLYPKAKVVLTVRDPVRWYKSVGNTIRQFSVLINESWLGAPLRLMNILQGKRRSATFSCWGPTYLGPKYPRGMYGAVDSGQETAVSFFNDWNEQVKREIPSDRLLVFQVNEGWEPLCKFLGVPVPEEQFPNVNDTEEMRKRIWSMKRSCYISWGLAIALAGVSGYLIKDHLDLKKLPLR